MVDVVEQSKWMAKVEEDPNHSTWYVERFRTMAAEGKDLAGEARLIDAMVKRNARILDAGCGPGRVGAELHNRGHQIVGVDVDPTLIDAAIADHPGPTWLVHDLAELDLPAKGIADPFDLIVSAGNVVTFLAPSTRVEVLTRLGRHLAEQGRLVIGFGLQREYELDDFRADASRAGLAIELELASWDVQPFGPEADFLVAVLRR